MLRLLQGLAFICLVMFALPAHALDCSSAAETKDRLVAAICSDPQLKQADQEMNRAYDSLYRGRDKKQQRAIKTLQKSWLSTRGNCETADVQCLLVMIRSRTDFLRSADGIGPMSQGKLVFKRYYVPFGTDAGVTDITLFEFEDPDTVGKKAFNAAVEKTWQEYAGDRRTGNAPSAKDDNSASADYYDCSRCAVEKAMEQPFQTKNFISAPLHDQSSSGIHDFDSTSYINQYLDKGQKLTLGDLLREEDVPVLAKQCHDRIMADLGDQSSLPAAMVDDSGADFGPSSEFIGYFRDPANWEFDGKSITFSLPFNNDATSCTLPYEAIRLHLAEGAALPSAVDQKVK